VIVIAVLAIAALSWMLAF